MIHTFSLVSRYLHPVEFKRGEVLMSFDTQALHDHLLLLTDGLIEVQYIDTTTEANKLITVLEPGQLVGDNAVFNSEHHDLCCIAATSGCGLALEREDLRLLTEEQPALACEFLMKLMPHMIAQLRDINRKLTSTAQLCQTMQDEINSVHFDNRQLLQLICKIKAENA